MQNVQKRHKMYIIICKNADVVELVDTTVSKAVAERRGGSSPPVGTKNKNGPVVELEDTRDLKSLALNGRAGSSPAWATKIEK